MCKGWNLIVFKRTKDKFCFTVRIWQPVVSDPTESKNVYYHHLLFIWRSWHETSHFTHTDPLKKPSNRYKKVKIHPGLNSDHNDRLNNLSNIFQRQLALRRLVLPAYTSDHRVGSSRLSQCGVFWGCGSLLWSGRRGDEEEMLLFYLLLVLVGEFVHWWCQIQTNSTS